MTQQSTIAAAARLPRAPLWGIGRYRAADRGVDYPLGWDDLERDTAWATEMLGAWGIGRGSFVLIISAGFEAPWTEPLMRAIRRLRGTFSCAEIWGWDARRTEMFARRLPLRMILGLNAEVTAGLEALGGAAKAIGHVPHLLARPDAYAPLCRAGLRPAELVLLGPALALECPRRQGAHVNGAEWKVDSIDGQLHITSVVPRAHRVTDAALGIAGSVTRAPCACGRADPRIALAPQEPGR